MKVSHEYRAASVLHLRAKHRSHPPPSSNKLTTCFTAPQAAVKSSRGNQSLKANKDRKKEAQSIKCEPLIQSAVTAMYSPVTVPLTFPLLISLSHFSLPGLLLFLSLFISPPSSRSPPDALACLLPSRMRLHCTQEPCFYGSESKQASQQDAVVQMSRGRSSPAKESNSSTASYSNLVVLKHPPATSTSVAEGIIETKHAVRVGVCGGREGEKKKPIKEIFVSLKNTGNAAKEACLSSDS